MFRLYSKACKYAIRALLYLAGEREEGNLTARDVCGKARIPEAYTRKVFQSLVRGKYLGAVPGIGGGYRLLRKPGKVSILEIIHAVDGKNTFERCIMGVSRCSCRRPCLLHSAWEASKKSLLEELEARHLGDFVKTFTMAG
ncbi:MAG: hypothetical protein A3G33_03720 [Omnitrophica bacterium RIFCSPLOWO2_12_FULL_44_17]|uniref:Rrf2 family transcriptional regulator n=1 Tax=Candidatus Danuiimicrobium aquiferis TaxID=1801832 RepID=A0A1G1L2B1_9BACT|nr:MAG: hypothetical protein A3B72_08940 [Omnitrophica bacterium RIFCSPHIGHO2_02_FULL_45_28]OGW99290.1 MAG: hypothetical protein A3G33_03720 [Omnitrophica bacterium RIFCSPLOWO2_12_FULL_44_17]